MILFVGSMVYVTETGNVYAIPIAVIAMLVLVAYLVFKVPHYTDEERCERSGFTWQLTDELVKSGDNYVYRGYCIDL
jgi:hypothetical protein